MGDMEKQIVDALAKRVDGEITRDMLDQVWVPDEYKRKTAQDRFRRELYNDWKEVSRQARDPVQKMREEIHAELKEVKDAVRKLGIMLDSDAPTAEQLKKHKMLKEAYLKYKMIEKLTLGEDVK